MKLKALATVSTTLTDADVYLQRRGSRSTVGKVVDGPGTPGSTIGIRLTADGRTVLDPRWLRYALMHVHGTGQWSQIATGTLALVHITVADVGALTFAQS